MQKPFSKYNQLTVSELKEILKSKNLPVSGTKNVLINRLEEYDINKKVEENTTLKEKKIKIKCSECSTILKVPKSYSGKIKCPVCSIEQEVDMEKIEDLERSDIFSFFISNYQKIINKLKALDNKNISIAISISAGFLLIVAILTFLSAFTLETVCPEEDRKIIIVDGEEVISCTVTDIQSEKFLWETETFDRLFTACCMILPLSLLLAIVGYSIREEVDGRLSVSNPLQKHQNNKISVNLLDSENEKSSTTLVDKSTKVIQLSILGFSIGVSLLTIILTILVIIFFVWAIYLLLSSGSWFA